MQSYFSCFDRSCFDDGSNHMASFLPQWTLNLTHLLILFCWDTTYVYQKIKRLQDIIFICTLYPSVGDYFFYMATTDRSPNHRAVFATPVMTSPDGHVNITFLYCMFGDHTQSLSVFIKDMSLVSYESEIWSRDGKDADVWTSVTEHANVTGPFRVRTTCVFKLYISK